MPFRLLRHANGSRQWYTVLVTSDPK